MGPGGSALCRIVRARTARHLEAALEAFLRLHFDHHCFLIVPDSEGKLTSYLPSQEGGSLLRRKSRNCITDGDPWHHRCPPQPGVCFIKHSDHTSTRQWKKTSFFQNYPNPDRMHFGLSVVFWRGSKPLACMTLVRGPRDGDFNPEHLRCLEAAYGEILYPAVEKFIQTSSLEAECRAMKVAYNRGEQAEVFIRRPDEVIAGTRSGLKVLDSWQSGREMIKLRRDTSLLPSSLRSWCGDPETRLHHPRWNVGLTPISCHWRGESDYFILRFNDRLHTDNHVIDLETLSFGAREILHLLGSGKTNREIAASRGVSPSTARNQVSALLQHLGMRNRTELALLYHDLLRAEQNTNRTRPD
jgi:DNA-binding CsgD family transcriptional regulator